MALTNYEKELFKKELIKYYEIQVFDLEDNQIDLIDNSRLDYESANLVENMANSEIGFSFGLSYSAMFKCTFHYLASGKNAIDYNGAKIVVNQKLDYIDPTTETPATATNLIGTFWIVNILKINDKNKQYEITAYDYLNKIDWQDIDLKPYHLGMPLADYVKSGSLGRFGQDRRDMKTSLAYMSKNIVETIDFGKVTFTTGFQTPQERTDWQTANASFINSLQAAGLKCYEHYTETISTRQMFGNEVRQYYLNYSFLDIYPEEAFGMSYEDFIELGKCLEVYGIIQNTAAVTSITSFNAEFPNFFAPKVEQRLVTNNGMFDDLGLYNFTSNYVNYGNQSFITDLKSKQETTPEVLALAPFLRIPIWLHTLSSTSPETNRNIQLTESIGIRLYKGSLYDECVGSILDDENEYDLAINNDGVLNQKDFFDGMAKWFLYNISASKTGDLQVKRLYDLDLAMSNYGRAENDPIIKSISQLLPSAGLYPNTGLYPIGNQGLIELSKIKDMEIVSILKGLKKISFKVNNLHAYWNVSKSGIHTIIDSELGILEITFDDVENDSEMILDASAFSDNMIRVTYLEDPQFVFDDKRGYILMSALQYLNRAFGSITFSSIPYLEVGNFVFTNLQEETMNVLVVKNEIKGISVAQTQTITSM